MSGRSTRTQGARIAPIDESTYEAVLPLIAEYQRFYGVRQPDDERNRAFFRRFLHPGDVGLLLGAWWGPELAGFACLYWALSSILASETVIMNDLLVVDNHRGKGLGRALIEASADEARRRGAHHVEWLTHIDNRAAQRLYESMSAERSAWFGYEITTS